MSSVGSVLPLFLIIGVGYFLYDRKWVGEHFSEDISKIILKISLPCATFISVLRYLDLSALGDIGKGAIYYTVSLVLGYFVAIAMACGIKIGKNKRALFVNAIVNTNAVFIGMPLQIAIFGMESFRQYLVVYVISTISIWCIGAVYIALDAPKDGDINVKEGGSVRGFSWKRLLPAPMIGFLLGVAALLIGVQIPDFASKTLTYLADMVSPLSLICIGVMLCKVGIKHIRIGWDVLMVVVGRFIFFPGITIALFIVFKGVIGPVDGLMYKTIVLQAFTPTLSVLPILANESKTDVKYATTVVTITTLAFAVIIPFVVILLK